MVVGCLWGVIWCCLCGGTEPEAAVTRGEAWLLTGDSAMAQLSNSLLFLSR